MITVKRIFISFQITKYIMKATFLVLQLFNHLFTKLHFMTLNNGHGSLKSCTLILLYALCPHKFNRFLLSAYLLCRKSEFNPVINGFD